MSSIILEAFFPLFYLHFCYQTGCLTFCICKELHRMTLKSSDTVHWTWQCRIRNSKKQIPRQKDSNNNRFTSQREREIKNSCARWELSLVKEKENEEFSFFFHQMIVMCLQSEIRKLKSWPNNKKKTLLLFMKLLLSRLCLSFFFLLRLRVSATIHARVFSFYFSFIIYWKPWKRNVKSKKEKE